MIYTYAKKCSIAFLLSLLSVSCTRVQQQYPRHALEFRFCPIDPERTLLATIPHNASGGDLYEIDSSVNRHAVRLVSGAELGLKGRLGWSLGVDSQNFCVGLDAKRGSKGRVLLFQREEPYRLVSEVLSPAPEADDRFGEALAVGEESMVASSVGKDDAYLHFFTRINPFRYSHQQTVALGLGSWANLSFSVADDILAVGAACALEYAGDVYLYRYASNTWTRTENLRMVSTAINNEMYSRVGKTVVIQDSKLVVSGWSEIFVFDFPLSEGEPHIFTRMSLYDGDQMRVVCMAFCRNRIAAVFTARGEDVLVIWEEGDEEWNKVVDMELPYPFRTDFALSMSRTNVVLAGSDLYAYEDDNSSKSSAAIMTYTFSGTQPECRIIPLTDALQGIEQSGGIREEARGAGVANR